MTTSDHRRNGGNTRPLSVVYAYNGDHQPPPHHTRRTMLPGGAANTARWARPWWLGLVLGIVSLAAVLLQYDYGGSRSSSSSSSSSLSSTSSNASSLRVFGPMPTDPQQKIAVRLLSSSSSDAVSFYWYTRAEQRDFMERYEETCSGALTLSSNHASLVSRFDTLPPGMATELWKYCVLYVGVHNIYWEPEHGVLWTDWLNFLPNDANLVVQIQGVKGAGEVSIANSNPLPLHHGLLHAHKKNAVVKAMLNVIATTADVTSHHVAQALAWNVQADLEQHQGRWTMLQARCVGNTGSRSTPTLGTIDQNHGGGACAAFGGYCCQVWQDPLSSDGNAQALPVLALRQAYSPSAAASEMPPRPYSFADEREPINMQSLTLPLSELPYIATIRSVPTNVPTVSRFQTPNFFDILLANDCLPESRECFRCLKDGYKKAGTVVGGNCDVCRDTCGCYCHMLCAIWPPAKRVAATWRVTAPLYRKATDRLVPRIVHQTYFEAPFNATEYPNMSRLVESLKQSGWEYNFYNDDQAAAFISQHFPPEVREAYDAILPGAFKADLFRYCVLLIRGGVYVDVDVMLQVQLDEAVPPDVGFVTAQDEPGEQIQHRSCLWNGLIAAAPGHPFLAQTIETVVNNIRNRFTSVDYDAMLCPNPVLSVSHTVDTLFTCGPCILGASINKVVSAKRAAAGHAFRMLRISDFKVIHDNSQKRFCQTSEHVELGTFSTFVEISLFGR